MRLHAQNYRPPLRRAIHAAPAVIAIATTAAPARVAIAAQEVTATVMTAVMAPAAIAAQEATATAMTAVMVPAATAAQAHWTHPAIVRANPWRAASIAARVQARARLAKRIPTRNAITSQ